MIGKFVVSKPYGMEERYRPKQNTYLTSVVISCHRHGRRIPIGRPSTMQELGRVSSEILLFGKSDWNTELLSQDNWQLFCEDNSATSVHPDVNEMMDVINNEE